MTSQKNRSVFGSDPNPLIKCVDRNIRKVVRGSDPDHGTGSDDNRKVERGHSRIEHEKRHDSRQAATACNSARDGGPGNGGIGTLFVDVQQIATARIDRTTGFRISLDETFDVGSDAGKPVREDYQVPFDFQGTLNNLVVALKE